MTKLVIYGALLGAFGGISKSLCLAIKWILDPQGQDIYLAIVGLYISETLFITSICLTKGLAERSVPFLKRGAVIGIVSGLLAASISLSIIFFRVREDIFLHPWFDRVLVYAMTLGVSAGIISGFGNDSRRHVYSYSFFGIIAGGLASLAPHFAVASATAVAFLLFQTGSSIRLSWVFSKLGIYPIEGVAQSVIVWSCLAIVSKHLLDGDAGGQS
jgi:hypothetical protein